MDESVEINGIGGTSESSNMAVAASVLGAIKRFIGMFVLTDEEKMQAGIDVDNFHESHDASQVSAQTNSSDMFQTKGRIG